MTEDLDEIYRRASALDPSRPSEAVRRKVLEHAAVAAANPRPAANRARWRPAIFGSLAAAGLAGLLIVPRVFNSHPPAGPADTAAPAKIPPLAGGAPVFNSAPTPPATAQPRTADASRNGASRLEAAAPASPPTDPSAGLRRAAETGDIPALRAILGADVRIDAPDARGRTALMLAALGGHAESVDLLLAHGADPNAADADGRTPLNAALAADQPTIVAALRRAGGR